MVESGFKTKAQELIKLMVDTIADKEYAKLVSSIPPNFHGLLLLTQNRHQKMPAWDLGSGWLNNWLCGKNMKIKSLW